MKITILTGSPRRDGNTNYLAERFADGAREAEHEVFTFDCAAHKIGPCLACGRCGMNGPCVQKDGFEIVRGRLVEADMVVFATPVYYFGFSAQLKTVVDRFYSIHGKLGVKKCALIAAFGNPSSRVAEPSVAMYRAITSFPGWEDMGMILAAGVWASRDARSTDYGRQAYELGRSIK